MPIYSSLHVYLPIRLISLFRVIFLLFGSQTWKSPIEQIFSNFIMQSACNFRITLQNSPYTLFIFVIFGHKTWDLDMGDQIDPPLPSVSWFSSTPAGIGLTNKITFLPQTNFEIHFSLQLYDEDLWYFKPSLDGLYYYFSHSLLNHEFVLKCPGVSLQNVLDKKSVDKI